MKPYDAVFSSAILATLLIIMIGTGIAAFRLGEDVGYLREELHQINQTLIDIKAFRTAHGRD